MRSSGMLDTMQRQGVDLLRREYFPRVMSGIFAVWMLAIVSCVTSLVLAYLTIYGFTPWACKATRAWWDRSSIPPWP
jgi:phospholipid/cholesterol/gamma-HCH transport system permease protein